MGKLDRQYPFSSNFVSAYRHRNIYRRLYGQFDDEIWELIKKARKYLTPREYQILKWRWHEHKTLEEVSQEFGVTRERIRQMERKILDKLGIVL